MAKARRASRSAETGKFVTARFAKKHPRTTVNENIPLPKKRKK